MDITVELWQDLLTVLPELVLLLSSQSKSFYALLQSLEQDGFRNLKSRVVSLPELEVDLGKDAARDRRISVILKNNKQYLRRSIYVPYRRC